MCVNFDVRCRTDLNELTTLAALVRDEQHGGIGIPYRLRGSMKSKGGRVTASSVLKQRQHTATQ